MNRARYKELADKVYAFARKRDGLPGNWLDVAMSISDDGIISENVPDEFVEVFGQEEITALLQETSMLAPELREWARREEANKQKEFDEEVERTLVDDRRFGSPRH